MLGSRRRRWVLFAGLTLLVLSQTCPAATDAHITDDPAQLLRQADRVSPTRHVEFEALMRRLDATRSRMSLQQEWHLRYLMARKVAFRGDFKTAIPQLEAISNQSVDPRLAFRANATLIDLLVTESRYEEAFTRMGPLLDKLPQITDKNVRIQALGVASQLYLEAGQYDLAVNYADQLLRESDTHLRDCIGWNYKLQALFRSGKLEGDDRQLALGIAACGKAGNVLMADIFKSFVANVYLQRGQPAKAIRLLQKYYAMAERKHYPPLEADFNSTLALAYWRSDEGKLAEDYARRILESSIKRPYSEATMVAYQVLYMAAKKQGHFASALAYHEKYMAADKGYLNDVSAKALAFQTVKQQVLANQLQIETLNKQNRILQLQQALGKKAVETGRLYIILLLVILAFIAYVAYRFKRSQLSFMRMARRDSLTGLFNRQHFLDEAERVLRYSEKSSQEACLILIDLDYFKKVNDTHGHATGDEVLKRAVVACQTHLRSTDIFGRLGGEEFGILLPECSLHRVGERAEQLRLAIAEPPGEDDGGVSVTASFGVATTACSGYELRQLLIHADDALYQAKKAGRNRVVVFDCAGGVSSAQPRKSRTEM